MSQNVGRDFEGAAVGFVLFCVETVRGGGGTRRLVFRLSLFLSVVGLVSVSGKWETLLSCLEYCVYPTWLLTLLLLLLSWCWFGEGGGGEIWMLYRVWSSAAARVWKGRSMGSMAGSTSVPKLYNSLTKSKEALSTLEPDRIKWLCDGS